MLEALGAFIMLGGERFLIRKTAVVFGGSGFVGRHLVQKLARQGMLVRVAVRSIESANYLKVMGDVGQIVPIASDIGNKDKVNSVIEGADFVINLVGLLFESRKQNFDRIHIQGARNIAEACEYYKVNKLIQISSVGASEKSESNYSVSKAIAERTVREIYPSAIILRPSIIFGPEDNFINLFASIARFSPGLPVFGCSFFPKLTLFSKGNFLDLEFFGEGGTKFQPVYVGDVIQAIVKCIESDSTNGNIYELGGPRVLSTKELMQLILDTIGRRRFLIPTPFWYLTLVASFLEFLPRPLITKDQVRSLKEDNVVSNDAKVLENLDVSSTDLEAVIPHYLLRFRKGNSRTLNSV